MQTIYNSGQTRLTRWINATLNSIAATQLLCSARLLVAALVVFIGVLASSANADFATSGRTRSNPAAGRSWAQSTPTSQNSRTIFHRGSSPQANDSVSAGGDPFLDFDHTDRGPAGGPAGGQERSPATAANVGNANAHPSDFQIGGARNDGGGRGQERQQDWIHPSVVRVRAVEDDGLANGSGTLIGVDEKHGYIITNWHVVQGATGQVYVEFPDGFQSAATVMKTDADWDLAILVIWKPNALPMPLSPNLPSRGEPLIIAGYGQGSFRSAKGVMTEFVAPAEDLPFEMFEVSTAARQGDSGGPIVNLQGQLAGVLFGAGGGRTTGSHVGRLRVFLDEAFRSQGATAPQPSEQANVANLAEVELPRSEAQQPAAFHESQEALAANALAAELAQAAEQPLPQPPPEPIVEVPLPLPAVAPAQPILVAQAAPVDPPGPVPGQFGLPAAPLSSPVPTTTPSVIGGGVSHDLLAGIPVAAPYEYGVARQGATSGLNSTFSSYGRQPDTAAGLPSHRGGGAAFGDLQTFFVLFGVFAVVFVLLPRDRS